MDKRTLVRGLSWQHPTVSLDVGTLEANVKRVLPSGDDDLWSEVTKCIQEATRAAIEVKRKAQRLIGMFIEKVTGSNKPNTNDREFMDYLCERIKPKAQGDSVSVVEDDEEQEVDDTDLEGKGDLQIQFLQSFLVHLYSGNYPKKTGVGQVVNNFISRLADLGLYSPRARSDINVSMPFTPGMLVRSTATKLAAELKRMYRNGSHDIHDKVG